MGDQSTNCVVDAEQATNELVEAASPLFCGVY